MFSEEYAELLSQLEQIRRVLPPGTKAYLVGGAVRDAILRLPIRDLDFVLETDSIQTARQVANTLNGAYYPLDVERDTARVIYYPSDGGRRVLDFARLRGVDIENDLRDRDFTINALAIDIENPGTLIDPLNGASDLRAKLLRTCSSNALLDDPLRVLRAVRLASFFKLRIPPRVLEMMRQALPGINSVSTERIRDEIFRILDGSRPATSLRLLDLIKGIDLLFPELAELKGVQQSPPHVHDAWGHTLDMLQKFENVIDNLIPDTVTESSGNLINGLLSIKLGRFREQIRLHFANPLNPDRSVRSLLMFAVLYHDAAKPATISTDSDNRIRFFTHDKLGAVLIHNQSVRLHLSNAETNHLETIVRNHMRPLLLGEGDRLPTTRAVYRFFRDTGEAGVDICLLSLADVLATYGPTLSQAVWTHHLEVVRVLLEAWWERKTELVAPKPLLDGTQIMDSLELSPGPQIGELLEAIREAQVVGTIYTREDALELARSIVGGRESVEIKRDEESGIDLA